MDRDSARGHDGSPIKCALSALAPAGMPPWTLPRGPVHASERELIRIMRHSSGGRTLAGHVMPRCICQCRASFGFSMKELYTHVCTLAEHARARVAADGH
jgi:hypothetical protein